MEDDDAEMAPRRGLRGIGRLADPEPVLGKQGRVGDAAIQRFSGWEVRAMLMDEAYSSDVAPCSIMEWSMKTLAPIVVNDSHGGSIWCVQSGGGAGGERLSGGCLGQWPSRTEALSLPLHAMMGGSESSRLRRTAKLEQG